MKVPYCWKSVTPAENEEHTRNESQTGTDTDNDINADPNSENGFRVLDQLIKLKANEAVLCY